VAVQWLHAAQAPVRPRHCTQALLQQPDQLILSNTLPRPAARALFSLRLHSVSIAFRLCASSGERSARLRRLDWVSSAFATSLFEGVSSARLRRFDWVSCTRRSGESLSKRRFTRRSALAWSLSSGERSARLRRFDWVFCVLSRSLFEGVSSARLRRFDWVFCARRRAASVISLAWSGKDLPGGVVSFVVGMRPKMRGESGKGDVDGHRSDRHHT